MKRLLHIVIGLVAGLMVLARCDTPPVSLELPKTSEHKALEGIDSLMWHHPDSALAVMMEFAERRNGG